MLIDRADNYFTRQNHIHIAVNARLTMGSSGNNTSTDVYHRPLIASGGLLAGLVTFYSIVSFIAVTSNMLILLTILRRFVVRNTVNVFLASLAVSDLIMVLLSLFDCFAFINGSWIFGLWTCKLQSVFIEVGFTASTITLVAVSCERYLLICHPHMKRRSVRAIYFIVVSVWGGAVAICSPLLDGYIVYKDIDTKEKTEELVCANKRWELRYQRLFYMVYSLITYLIPLIMMAFAHWRISMAVKGRRPSMTLMNPDKKHSVCFTIKEESSGGSGDMTAENNEYKRKASGGVHKTLLGSLKRKTSHIERDINRRERRIKAVRLLFVVTVTFIALWTPFILLRLVLLSGGKVNDYLYKFSEVLILSSTAVNGFIYAFMSPPFRKGFKAILCCQRRGNVYSRDSGPSMSNSEDNKLAHAHNRLSRGSDFSGYSYGGSSRNGTLNSARKYSTGNKTSV